MRGHVSEAERRGSALLWAGVLVGPLAWSLHLAFGWGIEEVIACAPATSPRATVWGIGVKTLIIGVTLVLAGATAAGGWAAWRCWRRARARPQDQSVGNRAEWMAGAGVMLSAVFLFMILVGLLPPLLLDACRSTL